MKLLKQAPKSHEPACAIGCVATLDEVSAHEEGRKPLRLASRIESIDRFLRPMLLLQRVQELQQRRCHEVSAAAIREKVALENQIRARQRPKQAGCLLRGK